MSLGKFLNLNFLIKICNCVNGQFKPLWIREEANKLCKQTKISGKLTKSPILLFLQKLVGLQNSAIQDYSSDA